MTWDPTGGPTRGTHPECSRPGIVLALDSDRDGLWALFVTVGRLAGPLPETSAGPPGGQNKAETPRRPGRRRLCQRQVGAQTWQPAAASAALS